MVVSVGIDISKDKHNCFIASSESDVLADVFIMPNTNAWSYPPILILLLIKR